MIASGQPSVQGKIALIGFMGSGKSTVSRILAGLLHYRMFEVDDQIIARSGRVTIAEIFAADGEEHFRALEAAIIGELCDATQTVISCGGGAVMHDANVAALRANGGILIYLRTEFATLRQRVVDLSHRPLFADHTTAEQLYTKRSPRYAAVADWVIDTDGLSPEQVAERIAGWISEQR